MKKNALLIFIVALCCLLCEVNAEVGAENYVFTPLNYPGAYSTYLSDMNDSGQIVGYTALSQLPSPWDLPGLRGFLYNSTTNNWSSVLNYPGAISTSFDSINNSGLVVGTYYDNAGNSYGFLYNSTTDTWSPPINFLNSNTTGATGINNTGQIVGLYVTAPPLGGGGFMLNSIGGTATPVNYPGAYETRLYGLNDAGQVVGDYFKGSGPPDDYGAFIYNSTTNTWAAITNPLYEGIPILPRDINNSGQIVGNVPLPVYIGFLKQGDTWTNLIYPGATSTHPLGINNAGQIVGIYVDSNYKVHGFLATPASQSRMYGLFIGVNDGGYLSGDLAASNVYEKFKSLTNSFVSAGPLTGDVSKGGISFNQLTSYIQGGTIGMRPGDTLVFYGVSHGSSDNATDETTMNKGDEFLELGNNLLLTDDDLYSLLKDIPNITNVNKWFIIDSCHSGGFWGDNNPNDEGDLGKLAKSSLIASAHEDGDPEGIMFIADDGPMFTNALLEGLTINPSIGYLNADVDKNSIIDFQELKNWILSKMRVWDKDGTIVYEGGFGDPHTFSLDMWNPICFKTDDFDGILSSPPVPEPITIDIKPGSDTNCINQNEKGVIPVAIFGSADLDVTQIDIDSLSLQGLAVKMAGKSNKYLAHYDYVNSDNYLDLIVHFQDSDGWTTSGNGYATLTGKLINGTNIEGKDSICIVP